MELRVPSKATLRKYGLSAENWRAILASQSGKCPICGRTFGQEVKTVIDHQHVRGFKKMKPDEKRKYVRGILCIYCNFRVLTKGMTLARAKATVLYLKQYGARLAQG